MTWTIFSLLYLIDKGPIEHHLKPLDVFSLISFFPNSTCSTNFQGHSENGKAPWEGVRIFKISLYHFPFFSWIVALTFSCNCLNLDMSIIVNRSNIFLVLFSRFFSFSFCVCVLLTGQSKVQKWVGRVPISPDQSRWGVPRSEREGESLMRIPPQPPPRSFPSVHVLVLAFSGVFLDSNSILSLAFHLLKVVSSFWAFMYLIDNHHSLYKEEKFYLFHTSFLKFFSQATKKHFALVTLASPSIHKYNFAHPCLHYGYDFKNNFSVF